MRDKDNKTNSKSILYKQKNEKEKRNINECYDLSQHRKNPEEDDEEDGTNPRKDVSHSLRRLLPCDDFVDFEHGMTTVEGIDGENVDEEKDDAVDGKSVGEGMCIEELVDVVDGLGDLRNGEVEAKKSRHDSGSIEKGIAENLECGKERFFQFGKSPNAVLMAHSTKHHDAHEQQGEEEIEYHSCQRHAQALPRWSEM